MPEESSNKHHEGGEEDGVSKACLQQAAADPRGSRTCVCANTLVVRGGTCREKRANERPVVVPSSRRGQYLQWDAQEGRPGCPQGKVVTTCCGDDRPHLSLPDSQPCIGGSKRVRQVTGKAGENGQYSGDGAARSPWTRPSARVMTHPRPQRASDRSRVGIRAT